MKVNKDFELFRKEFTKWQNMFGLNGWKVYFKHEPLEGCFASIHNDLDCMVSTVTLNSVVQDKDKPFKNIKQSAKHEAIHLLLARLELNGMARFSSSADIYESCEELVHKLEGLLQS